MAPMRGPTKQELLRLLRRLFPQFPITLGRYSPEAVVDRQGDAYVLFFLEMDEAAAAEAGKKAIAEGRGWRPEQTWQFLKPGKVLVREEKLSAFIRKVEGLRFDEEERVPRRPWF